MIPNTPSESTQSTPAAISLLEFNNRISALVNNESVKNCWVTAETTDVMVRGHCYMYLLQKNEAGNIVAKVHAAIWASIYSRLDARFMAATGSHITSGIKVMVKVSASFHPAYGLSLTITDIDPNFTLGDMVRQRLEILNRLKREGILEMNRQLAMPLVPQRIAVISAAGAAGYGDFMKQLAGNPSGITYYTCLFQASMQGVNTAPSIIAALDRINANAHLFDCVAIIRGGGSTTDLNSFDNYDLAANIAQFPLPVITGIGHERDVTVLDYVANSHLKTPTAVAEFLISFGTSSMNHLSEVSNLLASTVRESVSRQRDRLSYLANMVPTLARHIADSASLSLNRYATVIPVCLKGRIAAERSRLDADADRLLTAVRNSIMLEDRRLQSLSDKVEILSPRNTLRRGFSLTMCNGRIITSASQLKPGDVMTTHFNTDKVKSTVIK